MRASRDKIDVVDGSFDDLPFEANSFDAVWSQDAILHAPDRKAVLDEVARVLKPGGQFIFTDPMQADDLKDSSALSRSMTASIWRIWPPSASTGRSSPRAASTRSGSRT